MRITKFGSPPPRPRSEATVLIVEPRGLVLNRAPTNLVPGETPFTENFFIREGGIRPRPTLSQHTTNSNPYSGAVLGGTEVVSSTGTRFDLTSGRTRWAWYSAGSYSLLSFVNSGGGNAAPSAFTNDRVNYVQVYAPTVDDMIAIGSYTSSYQTLFCWRSGATIFSQMTEAPKARWVAAADNFVLAANVQDSSGSKYIQRVQWSHRGDPFVWTPVPNKLAGFEDLLDAKGEIRRIIAEDNGRVIIFFDEEIWAGYRGNFPSTWQFAPLDRTVGCPYGMTVAMTPRGIMFMARDLMPYLLPKGGAQAQPIGLEVHPYLRANVVNPEISFGLYDPVTQQYQLYYVAKGEAASAARRGAWLNLFNGQWSHQHWQRAPAKDLACGWVGALATGQAGLTWSDLSGVYTWSTLPFTWGEMAPITNYQNQVVHLGGSEGTIWYLNSVGTNDDGTERYARWRSSALGGETPERVKMVNAFRVDYRADVASTISVAMSRDAGETFDSEQTVALQQSVGQMDAVAYPYSAGRFPMFEVRTTGSAFDLLRFWLAARIGGR